MTDRIRDRIAEALDDAYQRHYDEGYGLPAQEMATDILAALLDGAEREPRTRLDDLTSDDLDRLYDDLDRYAEVLGEMNEQAVTNAKQLAALREVARGYCPACGRGDCAPTADQWYKQRQRADRAEAELRQYTEADSADAAAGSYAGRAEQAEQERDTAEATAARIRALYEQWVKGGPPPLGTSMSRWWDRRLAELHRAIQPPAHDADTPPAPAATEATGP